MKWIDTGDIRTWVVGKQRHCAETLPELIRRLIFATAGNITEIDFPSGDSIAIGEWDGRLNTPVVSPFFPTGISGWEISTKTAPGRKADDDYKKRTADPRGLKPNESSLVFVTPRAWKGRMSWQSQKLGLGEWKDIRVIGPDALEQWLESAPAVSLWLAGKLGKVITGGIRGIESFWEEWSLSTNPPLSPELVVGGRTRELESVHTWLSQQPALMEVQGDSPDEGFAFLFATINSLPDSERSRVLSRCIIVDNITEFRQCIQAFQNPLIIAAPGDCLQAAGLAVNRGHHVFLSMDSNMIDSGGILRLSRPKVKSVETGLVQAGLSEVKSEKVARDYGRSIAVLRRGLSISKAISAPDWASAESAKFILPALLGGAWSEDHPGDREILETLSGMRYNELNDHLNQYLTIDDAPLRKIGGVWVMKSSIDAWFILARHLTPDLLRLFSQAVKNVLQKVDPKYELPPEQRWAASVYGKSNPYSEWIRKGVSGSLVLLTVYGDRSSDISNVQTTAGSVVKEILSSATTWQDWASLKDVTPLLAEAAPEVFIQTVSNEIKNNPDVFKELMGDSTGGVFSECRHSGLLWALEALSWSPNYFSGAVEILTMLAGVDPGGSWHNRPSNTLQDIFYPGFPQTHADPKERLEVLDRLIVRNPKMVWGFAKNYYAGGVLSESYRFHWRETGKDRRGLQGESGTANQEYLTGLLSRLTGLACTKENAVSAMDEFTRLSEEIRYKLVSFLAITDVNLFSKDERDQLLQNVREAMSWIISYGQEDLKKHLTGLRQIIDRFSPVDPLERVAWLLSTPWPRLPESDTGKFEQHDQAVRTAQNNAARELLDKVPLKKIINFAQKSQYPGVVGLALGRVVNNNSEDTKVTDAILSLTDNPNVIKGYAQGRVESSGLEWVNTQISRLDKEKTINPQTAALLFYGLPDTMSTWQAISRLGVDFERAYWKQAGSFVRAETSVDAEFVIVRLLDAERLDVALEVAGNPKLSISSAILQRLLQVLISIDPNDTRLRIGSMEEYHLGHIFSQLYDRNELSLEEIAKLEWPFALIFGDLKRYLSMPLAIHRLLQTNPQLFAQLVSYMYKKDDGTSDTPGGAEEKRKQSLYRGAHAALDTWHSLPGQSAGGVLDEKSLSDWVDAVRKQCAMSGHVTGGDIQIGFLLAHAPYDPDGVWPHAAVRSIIERLGNDVIDDHIRIGQYNNRGVTSRSLSDGKKSERSISQKYKDMAEKLRTKWPRTAGLLFAMYRSYESDAKREDIMSDLNELR